MPAISLPEENSINMDNYIGKIKECWEYVGYSVVCKSKKKYEYLEELMGEEFCKAQFRQDKGLEWLTISQVQ